jgi:hypothetical protein
MKCFKLSTNWAVEIGFHKILSDDNLLFTGFDIRYKGDHRGLFFHFYIIQAGFEFNVYDVRHEDYDPDYDCPQCPEENK